MAILARDDCLAQLKDIASFIAGGEPRERLEDHERLRETYDWLLDRYAVLMYEEAVSELPTSRKRTRKALAA